MRRFWGWELATYLFLGGLGGGMLTFAMVLGLIVYPSELWQLASSVLVFGVLIAIIVLAVGTGLLVFELGQWKVFYRAFVTKTAVIKWGAVLLSVAMIFAGLFLLWSITWLTFFPFIPCEGLAKFFLGVAGVAGFCVMVYTGVLLSSLKARPFWNTPALPVLFTVSALSTGACLLSLCVGVFPFPQEWLLEPFAGEYARILFAVGLIGASFLAACVLPLTTAFVICEAFGWEAGVSFSWKEAPIFKSILTFVIAFSAVIVLIPNINLMQVMLFSQFVCGVILPVLLVFMAIIAADKHIMGKYRVGRVSRILIWATVIVVSALTVALLVMQILGI